MDMKLLVGLVTIIAGLVSARGYAAADVQCQVSLPQQSTPVCKLTRNAVLCERRKTFTLKHDPALHGFAVLNMTGEQLIAVALNDPFTKYFTIAYVQTTIACTETLQLYNNITDGEEINNMSDYLGIAEFFSSALEAAIGPYAIRPSEHEAFIDDKTVWLSDKCFTQQRLAGTNPMSLKRVTIQEPRGLDWKKLKKTLNRNFDWDAAVQAALKTEDSLEDAIKQGRIYALRYELCDDMPRSPDLTDYDPRRTVWNFLSPIALFASKVVRDQNRNELVPVAIQMDYKPDSAVYTPNDGDNWTIAKLTVQITDLGYVQMVEHLAKIHYLMEPFCVILKRTMAPLHPLNQILKYHCREVTVPNTLGSPVLFSEAQLMDLLFSLGNTGAMRLFRDAHPLATWDVTDFRAEIKKRGLDDKKLLPYFPYRDDGEVILDVIEHMVKHYVDLYYKNNRDVEMDAELQAYVNELSMKGKGPTGGIGRIQGFPTRIDTKKELCGMVSRIISHMSVQHAALNYLAVDYAQYIPNQPTKLYNDTRVSEGKFSVYRLPNRLTSAIEASFTNSLATFRFDSLFDYGNELQDNKAGNLVDGYYNHLIEVVQPRMQAKNERRKTRGDLTYPYLIPRWLPNGIQT